MKTLILNLKENAYEHLMYFLTHIEDDILNIEIIDEIDPDFQYIIDARERRKKGEKLYTLDEVYEEIR